MSLEVLRTEFNAYKQECAKDRNALAMTLKENLLAVDGKLAVMHAAIENRVTFEHFYWVVGILLIILMSILGYIIVQIKEMSTQLIALDRTSAVVQNDVGAIKDKLGPYNIEFTR